MQYVRSLGGSVSKTWNSINPATLSGAVDVIVVEQDDGSLACSPFHVRFGKFSLLRPYEKKVEFRVNDVKQDYGMKLGEGGEAFFVLETSGNVPESLQTSPVVSPIASPESMSHDSGTMSATLPEPEFLDLNLHEQSTKSLMTTTHQSKYILGESERPQDDIASMSLSSAGYDARAAPEHGPGMRSSENFPSIKRSASEEILGRPSQSEELLFRNAKNVALSLTPVTTQSETATEIPIRHHRTSSPPPVSIDVAVARANALSQKLWTSNIPSLVMEDGNLMINMTGYKVREEDALRAEIVARKILAEELEGNYDIGSLIGADEQGNLWIYSSEEAKENAVRQTQPQSLSTQSTIDDAASDPGHFSDDETIKRPGLSHQRAKSEEQFGESIPRTESLLTGTTMDGDTSRSFAKTLRLTSDQLQALNLKPGANAISFSVNRATCQAHMYYWKDNNPIVISDIDGTITKSDALGHVLNMIGRDWTHLGVAKLYTDITANGYHLLYLTSRSVGQADTTRAYLNGVAQEGFKLPKGPVIMSPDRTMAALRREIYLRKPEVFKMACLRDIRNLYSQRSAPFYAGFGNRFTDALSYRSVNIPSSRIFTINSEAEVSLDLLSLNTYRSSYVSMREIVDHFFPPVGLLVTGGGEEFTDFSYWRDLPPDIEDFPDSESDSDEQLSERISVRSEDEGSDSLNNENLERMGESYFSNDSEFDDGLVDTSTTEVLEGYPSVRPSVRSRTSSGVLERQSESRTKNG